MSASAILAQALLALFPGDPPTPQRINRTRAHTHQARHTTGGITMTLHKITTADSGLSDAKLPGAMLAAALALAALAIAASPAAAANLLVNGGFEAAPTTGLKYDIYAPNGHVQHYPLPAITAQYLPGWTIGDPSVSDLYRGPVAYSLVPALAAEGSQYFSLNWSPAGGITLDNTVSQAFTLGVDTASLDFSVFMSTESGFAGSTLQAEILGGGGAVVAQSPLFTHLGGNGVWSMKSWSTPLAAGSYTLRLHGIGAGNAWDVLLDGASLSAVEAGVPEPATWAMMIAGFGLVGGAVRRRCTGVRFRAYA